MHTTTIIPPEVPPGTILVCSRCNHKWAIRKRDTLPKNCPKCRSTLWLKKYYRYTCMKCNHEWGTANDSPQRCPKCHTSKWNTPPTPETVKPHTVKCKLRDPLKTEVLNAYSQNKSCFKVAADFNLALSDVIDALLEAYPDEKVHF